MKLLVTGGAGFIGANFIHYWLDNHKNDEITNLDKLTYAADLENLKEYANDSRYSLIKGDIADKETAEKAAKNVDIIINFAAESHVDNSIKDSSNFIRSNIVGVHNLLEIVRKTKIRFHQISTDEVYGDLPLGSNEKFTENSPYRPKNPYSATKAAADHLVRAYFNTYGIPATISNCSNNHGKYQHPEKLIPKTIINALQDKQIPVYGNGMQVRDWIYVEDHCSAIDLIINKGRLGETYLVGANGEKHNLDVIKIILEKLGKSDSLIKHVEDRLGHDVRYAIAADKIMKELGWKPKVDFDEGIDMTIDFYKKTLKRYQERAN